MNTVHIIWKIREHDEASEIIDATTNEFWASEITRIIGMSHEYGGYRVYITKVNVSAWSGLMGADFHHVINPEVGHDTERII